MHTLFSKCTPLFQVNAHLVRSHVSEPLRTQVLDSPSEVRDNTIRRGSQNNVTKLTSTEIARCVGCLGTSSGWLKHSEPPRTYTILTITELVRCVGCFCTSSGWFKHSEPHRTYTILTITELARCVGCLCTSSGWFKHSEPQRTYTNHTITELARCVGCFCTSSGGSSTANLHEPHHHSFSKVCRVLRH